jgi:hypothetical protein
VQVAQRLVVDGEDRGGRAVLRRHVADGRTVRERHVADALPVELDEVADDAVRTQHLRDREHEVGRGRTLRQFTLELGSRRPRDEHGDRLAEHGGLGLDATDAPADARPDR